MPAFQDTIARQHTTRIFWEDGSAFECIRQSGLFDLEDLTFEHTTVDGFAMDLPSGRHKIGQVTLVLVETGNVRQHFANLQLGRITSSFQYNVVDYEGVERDHGTGHGVRILHTRLEDTERNTDGAVTVEVILSVMEWTN